MLGMYLYIMLRFVVSIYSNIWITFILYVYYGYIFYYRKFTNVQHGFMILSGPFRSPIHSHASNTIEGESFNSCLVIQWCTLPLLQPPPYVLTIRQLVPIEAMVPHHELVVNLSGSTTTPLKFNNFFCPNPVTWKLTICKVSKKTIMIVWGFFVCKQSSPAKTHSLTVPPKPTQAAQPANLDEHLIFPK